MTGKTFSKFFLRIGDFLEKFFSWKGGVKNCIEWTERRGCRIEKIEGSSVREGGFSLWSSSRNTVNLKMEISDADGARQGLYLMHNPFFDSNFALSRFVALEEIQFRNPYRIINDELVLIQQENKNYD